MKHRFEEPKGYLKGAVTAKIKSLASTGRVRKALSDHPGLTKTRDGALLRYAIDGGEEKDHFFVLEICKERISVEVYAKTSPLYFVQEAVLRVLGICSFLGKECELDFNSLYPYLLEVISKQQLSSLLELEEYNSNRDTDTILAKRILDISRQNQALNERVRRLDRLSERLLASVLYLRHNHNADREGICKEYGIDEKQLDETLARMPAYGYRVVQSGENRINLVKL